MANLVEEGIKFQEKYKIRKWFPDTAYPGSIKTWSKKVGTVASFQKDVMGGIEATRGLIVTTTGARRLLILDTPRNKRLRETFKNHMFTLDATGEPTDRPDDATYSDTADAIRYLFQNVNGKKGAPPSMTAIGSVVENILARPKSTGEHKGFSIKIEEISPSGNPQGKKTIKIT